MKIIRSIPVGMYSGDASDVGRPWNDPRSSIDAANWGVCVGM